MDIQKHWETIYSRKAPERLAWYTPHLQTSLRWINDLHISGDGPVIDVGCGVSTLIDDLLSGGYDALTGVDFSTTALEIMEDRLADRGPSISWIKADITKAELPGQHYALWHDRAVFHFLTNEEHQAQYIKQLSEALRPGGHAILAVFSPTAPPVCSGLRVQRYTARTLSATLGENFNLIKEKKEVHITPGGVQQVYQYCLFRKQGDAP